MKELGITKGECKVDRHPHIDSDNRAVYRVSTYRIPTKEELQANSKMIEDSINTANECNLLPSELLQRYNEAIEVLDGLLDDFKYYISEMDEEPQRAGYILEAEQTISKANGN